MKHRFPIIVLFLAITVLQSILIGANSAEFPDDEFLKVVTIFTNDIHGGIDRSEASFINPDFPPMLGGGAVAGRYIMQKRQEAKENGWGFLLIDAGDFYQGTPLGTLSEGEAVIEYMNTVQYDVLTVGNHEFDNGWKNLKRLSEIAEFPFLAANLYRLSTGELAEFVQPYIIKEYQGIKIGIIGATLSSTPSMSFPEHVEDMNFKTEIEALEKYLPEVKAQGVYTVIFLTHAWLAYDPEIGYRDMMKKLSEGGPITNTSAQEIAHHVPGIDIIFSGHLHKGFYEPWEDPVNHTLIFQNYANGSNLGHVNFYIHRKTGTLAGYDFVNDAGAIFTLFEDDFLPDTNIAKKIDYWVQKAEAGFDEVIGSATAPISRSGSGESPMGNLTVDAMRISANADIAFSNYGGVRADISAGPITPRRIFSVMPFGNRIVAVKVRGSFLKALVEDRVSGTSRGMLVSGTEIVIDRSKPDGSRLVSFKINGEMIEADRYYTLAISDYLAEGNSGYDRLTTISPDQINYTGILFRQAIIDYIKRNSPIIPHVDGRWKDNK
ncbi:MAG: bifunctional metallophosphatase/5'-nucleotidase [Candidatus Marinimicrobia bacterium]|nr:bifunctional metallophosphatase/5'-nucleotidase [Candidatus Neomarinimicrobiota bacterium]MBL7067825.1 bifunctional metallophosphatase/5'-nucleotidase [Candidatus Neomarinimicrobiota bacterium]